MLESAEQTETHFRKNLQLHIKSPILKNVALNEAISFYVNMVCVQFRMAYISNED